MLFADCRPTRLHRFLAKLSTFGGLLRIYTQNVDGLEAQAGIASEQLIMTHGDAKSCRCNSCGEEADFEKFKGILLTQKTLFSPKKELILFWSFQICNFHFLHFSFSSSPIIYLSSFFKRFFLFNFVVCYLLNMHFIMFTCNRSPLNPSQPKSFPAHSRAVCVVASSVPMSSSSASLCRRHITSTSTAMPRSAICCSSSERHSPSRRRRIWSALFVQTSHAFSSARRQREEKCISIITFSHFVRLFICSFLYYLFYVNLSFLLFVNFKSKSYLFCIVFRLQFDKPFNTRDIFLCCDCDEAALMLEHLLGWDTDECKNENDEAKEKDNSEIKAEDAHPNEAESANESQIKRRKVEH